MWTINSSLVNEARFGFLRQSGFSSTPTLGKGYPEKLGLINAAANNFPNVSVGGVVPAGLDGGGCLARFQLVTILCRQTS